MLPRQHLASDSHGQSQNVLEPLDTSTVMDKAILEKRGPLLDEAQVLISQNGDGPLPLPFCPSFSSIELCLN